jgi:hypothetical protein
MRSCSAASVLVAGHPSLIGGMVAILSNDPVKEQKPILESRRVQPPSDVCHGRRGDGAGMRSSLFRYITLNHGRRPRAARTQFVTASDSDPPRASIQRPKYSPVATHSASDLRCTLISCDVPHTLTLRLTIKTDPDSGERPNMPHDRMCVCCSSAEVSGSRQFRSAKPRYVGGSAPGPIALAIAAYNFARASCSC